MKKLIIVIFIFSVSVLPVKAQTIDYKEEIYNFAESYGITQEKIYEITPEQIFRYIRELIQEQIHIPLKITAKVTAVIILCAIIKVFDNDKNSGVSAVTDSVSILIVFLSLISPLNNIITAASENLFQIKNFMVTFIPVYAGVSMASGEILTSTVYSGFFLTGLIFVSDFCIKVILPSIQVYFALVISNALSPYIRLKSLCDFYQKFVKWTLKTIVSVICFVLTIQTTISRTGENTMLKTGKAIVGTAIPVIGVALQEAVGSVYAGMKAIKGFAGVVGIFAVLNTFAPTFIMLTIYLICTNIMFVIADMFDLKSISLCVNGLSSAIEILISVIILFMVLLVFSLTIMISLTKGV